MPGAIRFRANVYGAMAKWRADAQLVDCLWHGLFDEEFENREAAGRALVLATQKGHEIADRLFDLACAPVNAETAATALSVLFFGWPTYSGLSAVIEKAKESPVPALQVTAILCAIRSGTKNEKDLEALLLLANSRRYFYPSYGSEIAQALIEGWPGFQTIHDLTIQSARKGGTIGNSIMGSQEPTS